MNKVETTFITAKVGNRVFSPLFKTINPKDNTNAVITTIKNDTVFGIYVAPDCNKNTRFCFSKNGTYVNGEAGQVLFWTNPIKKIPVKPKQKITKTGYFVLRPCLQSGYYPNRIAFITTNVYSDPNMLSLQNPNDQIKEIEFEFEL